MAAKKSRIIMLLLLTMLVLTVIGACLWLFIASTVTQEPAAMNGNPKPVITSPKANPRPVVKTSPVTVGSTFAVNVPNGWSARVSTQQDFIAIQIGTPGTIDKLIYNETQSPAIDYSGIPSWNGLTEHFYIRAITKPSQTFNPQSHARVTQSAFVFDDGTPGTLYSVTKDQSEAQKWGGLLKDSEWYGRVFVYKTETTTIEAHLAYYPSTKIDTKMFEQVARSIKP